MGIINDTSIPGLPSTLSWNMTQGGSGFSPPYIFPNPAKPIQITPPNQNTTTTPSNPNSSSSNSNPNLIPIPLRANAKPIPARAGTATRFARRLAHTARQDPPGQVFCSRELERSLSAFVSAEVAAGRPFPSAEQLRQKAREVLGPAKVAGLGGWTPAEDAEVLGRFMEVMRNKLGMGTSGGEGVGVSMMGMGVGVSSSSSSSCYSSSSPGQGNGMGGVSAEQMLEFDFNSFGGDFLGVATGGMPMD